jgi:ubiquinone/menaquinone biosynthesis C-methylase UbiE
MTPTKASIRATYEQIADSFAATRKSPWPEVSAFVESLRRRSRVLDVGSGNGRHAKVLSNLGHDTMALDFSRRLLTIGRIELSPKRHARRVGWIQGEATKLPFRASSFDAGICVAVLHHLPTELDRIAALGELKRVLRRGAPVFVSAWAREHARFSAIAEARASGSGDVEVPWTMPDGRQIARYYHLFKEGELERLIIECGLQGESFFRSAGNWFALARRND